MTALELSISHQMAHGNGGDGMEYGFIIETPQYGN